MRVQFPTPCFFTPSRRFLVSSSDHFLLGLLETFLVFLSFMPVNSRRSLEFSASFELWLILGRTDASGGGPSRGARIGGKFLKDSGGCAEPLLSLVFFSPPLPGSAAVSGSPSRIRLRELEGRDGPI